MLDDVQREMYKQKLLIEIAHFRQREQLYAEKREELLDLELHYRKNQKRQVKTRDSNCDRGETETMMVDGMLDKVKESRRKIDLQESAMNDLAEKMDEIKGHLRQRQQENNEMKANIESKANKGQQLQYELDRLAENNAQFERELGAKQADLRHLVNQKSEKEQKGWIADENLRKAQNDLFNNT